MKEVETEFLADGVVWDEVCPLTYRIQVYKATVGLMRLYEDADNVDSVSIPKAEGKVSVRPYVRGKPRKRSRPEPTEPLAQLGGDLDEANRQASVDILSAVVAEPRILDEPDSLGSYFIPKPAGHSEAE